MTWIRLSRYRSSSKTGPTTLRSLTQAVLLVGSALTSIFVVGVVALVISWQGRIRPTVDQRPSPGESVIVPSSPRPGGPVPARRHRRPTPSREPVPVVQQAPRTVFVNPAPRAPAPAPRAFSLAPAPGGGPPRRPVSRRPPALRCRFPSPSGSPSRFLVPRRRSSGMPRPVPPRVRPPKPPTRRPRCRRPLELSPPPSRRRRQCPHPRRCRLSPVPSSAPSDPSSVGCRRRPRRPTT